MTTLDDLIPREEQLAMFNRQRAVVNLVTAVRFQCAEPCGFRNRHVAMMIQICRVHHIPQKEIVAVIEETRKECEG